MLAQLRTGLGFRVAIAAAIVAALCFVVPPAAMAFVFPFPDAIYFWYIAENA